MQLHSTLIKLRFIVLFSGIFSLCITEGKAQYIDSSGLEGGLAGQMLGSAKEHKNRSVYTSLSPEIIDSIPDNKLSQAITDYIRAKMDRSLNNESEVLMKEPEAGRAVYIISQVEAEVNNGGFKQFFSSSAGKLGDQAEEAFRAIHAPLFAGLLKKANSIYKQEGSTDRLKNLDSEFYSLYDKEDLAKLIVNYIRKNKKAFKST